MISSEKYWNTWDPYNFAVMKNPVTGLTIVPGTYSSMENSFREFLDYDSLRLLEHEKSGRYCRLRAEHATAEYELEYLKPDAWTVMARVRCVKQPVEWGLRVNVLFTVGYEYAAGGMAGVKSAAERTGSIELVERKAERSLKGKSGDYCAAVLFDPSPYEVTFAAARDAVGRSMEGQGFKGTGDRDAADRSWASCRLTLEQTDEFRAVISEAHSEEGAAKKAQAALAKFAEWDEMKAAILAEVPDDDGTVYPGMTRAVHEIMNWNHVYSPDLGRAYTCIAKKWNAEFGDWYVFFTDTCYQMMMNAATGDYEMAAEDLDLALSMMTADGNFAGLLCGYQRWVDRAQPPVFAYCLLVYYLYTGDLAGVQKAYGPLRAAQDWYLRERSVNGDGLISLGTSMAGGGDYRGMKLAAKNETAMDNSPMYDAAEFDSDSCILQLYDVGITSLEILDVQCTAELARLLGRTDEAAELETACEERRKKAAEVLWNDADGIFANRMFAGPDGAPGEFGVTSPTSFYALAAGLADEEQLDRCVEHIFDPEEFFTECPLIAINAKDPSAKENRYWRGRTWAPQTFWTYVGLRRCGRDAEAHRLAAAAVKYFYKHWTAERRVWENYNPYTGEGRDTPTSQPFYSWTALLPFLWSCEQLGADPWSGFFFGMPDGGAFTQNRRLLRGALYEACSDGGVTTLSRNGEQIFESDIPARFKRFVWEEHYASVETEVPAEGGYVCFAKDAFRVCVDGEDLTAGEEHEMTGADDADDIADGTACRIALAPGAHKVEIWG